MNHKYIDQIRMKRHERKLLPKEVDEGAGLSSQTMYKFEKGQIRNSATIEKIVEFFGGEIVINFKEEV